MNMKTSKIISFEQMLIKESSCLKHLAEYPEDRMLREQILQTQSGQDSASSY